LILFGPFVLGRRCRDRFEAIDFALLGARSHLKFMPLDDCCVAGCLAIRARRRNLIKVIKPAPAYFVCTRLFCAAWARSRGIYSTCLGHAVSSPSNVERFSRTRRHCEMHKRLLKC
jgi:hypothetical protein